MSNKNTIRTFMLASVVAVVLGGCGAAKEAEPGPAGAPQAPSVAVASVLVERITEWDEFTGRLQAPQTVVLVPRVSGYIDKVNFEEGSLVQQGDLLFSIDDRLFIAEVARLKAQLKSAITAQQLADNDFVRATELSAQNAISAELFDTRQSHKQQTASDVASVQASLSKAELDLSFTRVIAPINGRVSNALITQGNYVTAGSSQLTHLVSTEKMYAYFDVDEQTYLKYAQLISAGERADNRSKSQPVYLALANEQQFNHLGAIDFVDNALNWKTGTMRLRATFDNNDGQLVPGLFAKLRLAGSASYNGVLISDKAIGTDLNNKFVLVVNGDNQLEYRTVTLGEKVNDLRIIKTGLAQNDRVVVNGLQRVRPKMKVEPIPTEMTSAQNIKMMRDQQKRFDQAQQSLTAQVSVDTTRS